MPLAFRYPLNELDSRTATTRVKFTATDTKATAPAGTVMLYMPPGVSFGDSATYDSFDMGAIGGAANDLVKKAMTEMAKHDNIQDKMSAISSIMKNFGQQDFSSVLTQFLIQVPPQGIQDIATMNAKQAFNPRTNTLFKNVGIRTYEFQFKMIAEDASETRAIRDIVNFFRKYLYPELDGPQGMIQRFPVSWDIQFYYGTGDNLAENVWIPKIHKCFLTGFTSSYNSDGNSFHEDGAPFDVSCTMSFTETRAYSRNDILSGVDAYAGTPAAAAPAAPPKTATTSATTDPLGPLTQAEKDLRAFPGLSGPNPAYFPTAPVPSQPSSSTLPPPTPFNPNLQGGTS